MCSLIDNQARMLAIFLEDLPEETDFNAQGFEQLSKKYTFAYLFAMQDIINEKESIVLSKLEVYDKIYASNAHYHMHKAIFWEKRGNSTLALREYLACLSCNSAPVQKVLTSIARKNILLASLAACKCYAPSSIRLVKNILKPTHSYLAHSSI